MIDNKKGLTAGAIILGLIIFGLAVSLIYLINYYKESVIEKEQGKIEKASLAFELLDDAVTDCLFKVSEEILYTASRQGGFMYPEKLYDTVVVDNIYKVPVYLDCNRQIKPSLQAIHQDLSEAIKSNFFKCFTETIRSLSYMQIDYSSNKMDVAISFNIKDTSVRLFFPIKAKLHDSAYSKSEFITIANIPFLKMYNYTINLIEKTTTAENIAIMSRFGLNLQEICPGIINDEDNLFLINLTTKCYSNIQTP